MVNMNIPGWENMTPAERMQWAAKAMQNPCPEDQHEYQDLVFTTETMGAMLHVICTKCFSMQGWVY